jgi:hypothetical protein
MRSDPFNEYDLVPIVDCYHQTVIVAFDVEHDSVRSYDARVRISLYDVGWTLPAGAQHLMKPCIKRRLDGFVVLAAFETVDESPQGLSCDDPHIEAAGSISLIIRLFPKWVQERIMEKDNNSKQRGR